MKKVKKIIVSIVLLTMLVTSMPGVALAKDNSGIGTCAVISSCPVCMGRNIVTQLASRTYSYQGQTRYITDTVFDYCRDCGFRTSNRTTTYRDPNQ